MKKISVLILSLVFSLSFLTSKEKLSKEYKDWLESVSPIITKTEKEIFGKLKTEEERNKFIQAFWRQRDPFPDTEENEFYNEYMKRIQFADANFGRETSKKGSQTERGYFYLLLGPPLERQRFATSSKLLPLELWYYRGEVKYGLPPYFYIIFYQPQGLGEYRLYYPGVEGPEKLVIPSLYARSLNRSSAYQIIKEISGELANASLSYLPGDKTLGTTSFNSDTILSNVHSLAEKKFSDAYARSFLYYKDYVETEYSHNYIESDFKVKVFKNFDQFFIHWSVEPEKVQFALRDGQYYAAFQLILRMEDSQGSLILEKEEEIPLRITPEQYRKHERRLFSFQDLLPVIPGELRLFFLLKNKTGKDFTSFRTDVSVPRRGNGPALSNLLLYHSRERLDENRQPKLKAFAFDGKQYVISAHNNFPPEKDIGLYCQLYNIENIKEKSLLLEIFPVNAETPVERYKNPLEEVLTPKRGGIDILSISSSPLKPGYYQVHLSILDGQGQKLATEKEPFILLAQHHPVIPWAYSKLHPPFPNPEQLHTSAFQYFLKGEYTDARRSLEQALQIKDEPRIRLLLAKSLYALGHYRESLTTVFPVYQETQSKEAAKIIAVNYAGLKDWSSALIYLEKLMEQAAEISVLNLAAECYLNLNQPEKALPILQKSLTLNPNQAKIKELERKARLLLKREARNHST
jgi:GWxTD domain-containing protein